MFCPLVSRTLLVNGSEGIAVGIATSIPPHNLKEVVSSGHLSDQASQLHRRRSFEIRPGPDFPTGGIIYESKLKDIYRTGMAESPSPASCEIVSNEEGIPRSSSARFLIRSTRASSLRRSTKSATTKRFRASMKSAMRPTKSGLRIAIDLKDDAKPEAILAYLMSRRRLS
jgi:DNA gyrase subunit A